jgi:hypothetical protein
MTAWRFFAFILSSFMTILLYDYALLMSGLREYLLDEVAFRENGLLLVWGVPIALTIVLSVAMGAFRRDTPIGYKVLCVIAWLAIPLSVAVSMFIGVCWYTRICL